MQSQSIYIHLILNTMCNKFYLFLVIYGVL